MKKLKLATLWAACTLFATAPAAILFAPPVNAQPSPIVGVGGFSAVGGGTPGACSTGANSLTGSAPASTFDCSNGQQQGGTDCTCTEYSGQMKGTGVGAGTMTLDLIEDTSASGAGSFITVPAPGGALTCYATSGVGLMQAKTQLPILLFAVGGYLCPVPGSSAPASFSGSFSVINPELGAHVPPIPSQFPNASGSGAMAAQFSSSGNITFTLNGELKK